VVACDSLQQLEAWKMEGHTIRAWVQWKSCGDRGSKEFYNAARPKEAQACITELLSSEGVRCHDQEQLEAICLSFFSQLYQNRRSTVELQRAQASVLNRIQSKLTGEMRKSLRAPIGLEELTKAVKSMAKGKAPGPDGIIAEFYQSLWPEIGRDY
jgi:hypothetical protein